MRVTTWVQASLLLSFFSGCAADPIEHDELRRAEDPPEVALAACDDATLAAALDLPLGPSGAVVSTDAEECEQYAFAGDERCAELVADAGLSLDVAFFATPGFEACGCACATPDVPQGPPRACASDFAQLLATVGMEGYTVLDSGLLLIEEGEDCDGASEERCDQLAAAHPELGIDWVVHEAGGAQACGCQCDCVPVDQQGCNSSEFVFTTLECVQDADCCSELCVDGFCMECP